MYDGLPSRYQGWFVGSQANMAIYDRVEVVRGAQNVLLGHNSTLGAVIVTTARPSETSARRQCCR